MCTDAHKVLFRTYMMSEEVEYWWKNTRQRIEVGNAEITWANSKNEFLDKYLLVDVRSHKEIEFLELKHGNMIVADYAPKFEESSRFFPHYNGVKIDGSKCVKFESGLCPKIKQFIGY